MTSYQQSLKPGDEVRTTSGESRYVGRVLVTAPHGVLVSLHSCHAMGNTDFWKWEWLVEPPAPKAEPGVRYRRPITSTLHAEAVGLRDGRLWTAHETKDFDPNVWTKVDWAGERDAAACDCIARHAKGGGAGCLGSQPRGCVEAVLLAVEHQARPASL